MRSVCNSTLKQGALLKRWQIGSRSSLAVRSLTQATSNTDDGSNHYATLATILGASLTLTATYSKNVLCDESNSANQQKTIENLNDWLKSREVVLDKVEIRPSEGGNGYGMFAKEDIKPLKTQEKKKWWSRSKKPEAVFAELPTLASFPYEISISADTLVNDPVLGKSFSYMLEKNILDERTSVMAYLAFQRLAGEASPLHPWVQALPQTFDTPLYFSEEELADLRGTVLMAARDSVSRRLEDTWSRLAPILTKLARDLKLARAPTLDDFKWGYSVFWSRGQSIPLPQEEVSATTKLTGAAISNTNMAEIGIVEGIVPGLDFFNHVSRPHCWWDVKRTDNSDGSLALRLALHPHVDQGASAGSEVSISYGDKSNEELLMLYGFAVDQNPDEYLMLPCPIPAGEELDEMMVTKLELLRAYGLRPQFFLRAANAGKEGFPADVLDTLEVFVLKHDEVEARIEDCKDYLRSNNLRREDVAVIPVRTDRKALDVADAEARLAKGLSAFRLDGEVDELADLERELGLRMATISTLVRMLEIRVVDLEGAEGTGPLEADRALLSGTGEAALSYRRRAAVIYRAGQKQLARDLLAAARQELGRVLKLVTRTRELAKTRSA